ncbi:MAG: transglutaminase-like domain-containing protein [Planctomycetota bacterium]
MSLLLRIFLLDLVLLDLVFVQVTGQAPTRLLLPLYALTLASPFLVRFQDRLLYRAAWTLGLFLVFGTLVYDLGRQGLAPLLQDGLLLAAWCQVQVLNQIGPKQRPDLLFFNSFLIPLVTSFFSQDLAFIAVFALYVPVLLISLQLWNLERGGLPLAGRKVAWAIRGALRRSTVLLLLTLAVFLYWPRDFGRRGWVGEHFEELLGSGAKSVGFGDELRLGDTDLATLSLEVVLRARLLEGRPEDLPVYWTGNTFVDYRDHGWQAIRRGRLLDPLEQRFADEQAMSWKRLDARSWQRGPAEDCDGPRFRITFATARWNQCKLFLPAGPCALAILPPATPDTVVPLPDGTVRYTYAPGDLQEGRGLRYELRTRGMAPEPAGLQAAPTVATGPFLTLRRDELPLELRRIAHDVAGSLPPRSDQHFVVEALRAHLAASYEYLHPTQPGRAASLADFVAGRGGGHCEYFATTLALMLRELGIPCRLSSGYVPREWDPASRTLTIRKRDAHSWVEVLDPIAGWMIVDPSPASEQPGVTGDARAEGPWQSLIGEARRLWEGLASFDAEGRARAIRSLEKLPGLFLAALTRNPLWLALPLAVAVAALTVLLHRRRVRAAAAEPAVARYLETLRRLGIERPDERTPRELLASYREGALDAASLGRLARATELHERDRYAGGRT